jgi:hypothetical protein
LISVPYVQETPTGWTAEVQRTWTVTELPDGLRLAGDCPTCDHVSETLVRFAWVVHGLPADPERKTVTIQKGEKVLVVCDCETDHGAPPDRRGCGRAGYLLLVQDAAP